MGVRRVQYCSGSHLYFFESLIASPASSRIAQVVSAACDMQTRVNTSLMTFCCVGKLEFLEATLIVQYGKHAILAVSYTELERVPFGENPLARAISLEQSV